MQNRFLILAPALALFAGCIESAEALHALSSAETKFLELHGEHARLIAPGVYEVADDHAHLARFSFGRSGMQFDHARALQELELARAQRGGQIRDLAPTVSDKRLEYLEEKVAALEEAMQPRAFETGDIPACGIYGYADAYLAYNSAYINAEVSVNISGPVQPGLALAWAWAESGASGVQEELRRRGLGIDGRARLYAYASAGPDFCYRGKAEAMVNASNCPNDYVSQYREFSTDWCSFPP
jgi:hypothetical protein